MGPYKNPGNLEDSKLNVILSTQKERCLARICNVLVIPVVFVALMAIILGGMTYFDLPNIIAVFAFPAMIFVFIPVAISLSEKTNYPADAMRVDLNALIGQWYGTLFFDDIVQYVLKDRRIIIHQKDGIVLCLDEVPTNEHCYDDFYADFVSAISEWRVMHPESPVKKSVEIAFGNPGNLEDSELNVILVTGKENAKKLAPFLLLFLGFPMLVMSSTIYITMFFDLGSMVFWLSFAALLVSFVPGVMFAKRNPFPSDVMYVGHDALIGRWYGTIPFENIMWYNLEENDIRIRYKVGGSRTALPIPGHRLPRKQASNRTISLIVRPIPGYRHRYDELPAAFALAIAAWQSSHPETSIEQARLYGTWKAKALGGFLAVFGLGGAIMAQAFGMSSWLSFALMGMYYGILLIRSKRKTLASYIGFKTKSRD